jgi:hypothetical protein
VKVVATENILLDNSIKLVTDYYTSDNGQVKSEFYQDGNEVVFEGKGRRVTWKPQAIKYVDCFGIEDEIYTVQEVPLETKANYARYNRSYPDIDDWFIQENDRLKHQILIQGFQRDPMPWLSTPIDFVFGGKLEYDPDLLVWANEQYVTGYFETEGKIELRDSNNNIIFTLPEIVAYDSKIPKRAMTTGKYKVTFAENGILDFNIIVDNAWISDLERVYPLVIDPTVTTSTYTNVLGMWNSRKMARTSNNVLWTFYATETTPNGKLVYSLDEGQTWTDSGLTISNAYHISLFIDADDYMHIVYANGSYLRYYRGTPNAAKTAYTLNSGINIRSGAYLTYTDVIAHNEGTGYKVHIVFSNNVSSTSRHIEYARLNIDSAEIVA